MYAALEVSSSLGVLGCRTAQIKPSSKAQSDKTLGTRDQALPQIPRVVKGGEGPHKLPSQLSLLLLILVIIASLGSKERWFLVSHAVHFSVGGGRVSYEAG